MPPNPADQLVEQIARARAESLGYDWNDIHSGQQENFREPVRFTLASLPLPSTDQIIEDADRTIAIHKGVLRLKAENAAQAERLEKLEADFRAIRIICSGVGDPSFLLQQVDVVARAALEGAKK